MFHAYFILGITTPKQYATYFTTKEWTLYTLDTRHKVQWHVIRYITEEEYLLLFQGPSWSWSYGSLIYNYLCNQCLSPLMVWLRISIRAICTTLGNKVVSDLDQVGVFLRVLWFPSPIKLTASKLTELLLKVALNTIKQTHTTFHERRFGLELKEQSLRRILFDNWYSTRSSIIQRISVILWWLFSLVLTWIENITLDEDRSGTYTAVYVDVNVTTCIIWSYLGTPLLSSRKTRSSDEPVSLTWHN